MTLLGAGELWQIQRDAVALACDEVHVWRVELPVPRPVVEHLWLMLADEERQRAARFYFRKARESFVVGRGILRYVLAQYTGCEPYQVRFCYGVHGKPALSPLINADDIRFNVSHSGGLALFAVTQGREVGIDVEFIRCFDSDSVAERFFSTRENRELRAFVGERRTRAFFACWTRKEAYSKARGEGLLIPLDQFNVSVDPEERRPTLRVERSLDEASRWSLQSITPHARYVGAVAVQGHGWKLRCWRWPVPWCASA